MNHLENIIFLIKFGRKTENKAVAKRNHYSPRNPNKFDEFYSCQKDCVFCWFCTARTIAEKLVGDARSSCIL